MAIRSSFEDYIECNKCTIPCLDITLSFLEVQNAHLDSIHHSELEGWLPVRTFYLEDRLFKS